MRKARPGMTTGLPPEAAFSTCTLELLVVVNAFRRRSDGMPPLRTLPVVATAPGQSFVWLWLAVQESVTYTVASLSIHSAGEIAMAEASKSVWVPLL